MEDTDYTLLPQGITRILRYSRQLQNQQDIENHYADIANNIDNENYINEHINENYINEQINEQINENNEDYSEESYYDYNEETYDDYQLPLEVVIPLEREELVNQVIFENVNTYEIALSRQSRYGRLNQETIMEIPRYDNYNDNNNNNNNNTLFSRLIDNADYNQLSELENVSTGLLSKNLIDNSKVILNENLELFCSICQTNINNNISRLLFCNHLFHINCIDTWFINKNTCPNCKKKLE